MSTRVALVAMLALALTSPAVASPRGVAKRATKAAIAPAKKGAAARVAFARAGELRAAREVVGRREEPLTLEEQTAKNIEKLLRGPGLRNGITGLYVADAKTGQPLFAVNAEEAFNPASNVKMISTAAALELLGPDFRYPTRLLGPEPVDGVVHGDVFLLGSHDPTLTAADLDDIAAAVAHRGITSIDGNIVVGADPTRDGIFRANLPITVTAGEPGHPAIAMLPPGADHVAVVMKATTSKRVQRPRLAFKTETLKTDGQPPRIELTITGTIGKGGHMTYALWTRERTATAVYALRAALRAQNVQVTGDLKVGELGDYVGEAVGTGALPIELGRHESLRLADIVARVNKWSINWLADRVIMTASALARRQAPSMNLALEAMYGWLARNPHLAAKGVVLDTGSGLSYRTKISPSALVAVIRSAAGFASSNLDPVISQAWVSSLSIARRDGTLRSRLRTADLRARVRGKTGTLSTVIAMSGLLDVDPERPLAFALVTNTDVPLSKVRVRRAHDQVLALLCAYLTKTTKPVAAPAATPATPVAPELAAPPDAGEETEPGDKLDGEQSLDAEAAGLSR